jgi:hypothetical protein
VGGEWSPNSILSFSVDPTVSGTSKAEFSSSLSYWSYPWFT